MENNLAQLKKLAQIFNTDKLISPEEIQQIFKGIVEILATYKKDTSSINEDTKNVVNKLLEDVISIHKESVDAVEEKKSELAEVFADKLTELKKMIVDFKEGILKEHAMLMAETEEDTDGEEEKQALIAEIMAQITPPEVKATTVSGEEIIDKINELPLDEDNKIDYARLKNVPVIKGKSITGSPTVLANAVDLDGSTRQDTYAIVWDAARGRYTHAAGGGTGTGDVTGPASSVDGQIAIYNGATGKIIKTYVPTAGSVLFAGASGIVNQNNAKFFWDNINNRLGINTTSPLYSLEVKGGNIYNNSTGTGFFITNRGANTNFSGFQFNTNQVAQWTIGSRNDSTENLYFFAEVSGAIRATLTTAGLLGLGVAPTAVVTLKAGTATASTAPLKFTAGTVNTTPEAGAMEFTNAEDGLTFTAVSTRRKVVLDTATQTLINKRFTRRVVTTTQSATPSINTDNGDVFSITGLAQAITSMTSGLTGTPTDGDLLEIRVTDNGTARAITWGTSFAATTIPLPTTTVISTMLRVGFEWNATTSKWDCVATC